MKRVNVMDTATHIAIGVGLTALASQDPAMANTMAATATTLIAGSLIPDGDTVLKLKNNATYISSSWYHSFYTIYNFVAYTDHIYYLCFIPRSRYNAYMVMGTVSSIFTCIC